MVFSMSILMMIEEGSMGPQLWLWDRTSCTAQLKCFGTLSSASL